MKNILFIGYENKSDFILYIAKALSIIPKKVLIIDATINQRFRYAVTPIDKNEKYITEYEGFDVAIGFENTQNDSGIEDIKEYLATNGESIDEYDFILYDIDSHESITSIKPPSIDFVLFVTSFEKISIFKGIELLREIYNANEDIFKNSNFFITKILFSTFISRLDQQYIEKLLNDINIMWSDDWFEIPYDEFDHVNNIQNHYINKIRTEKLSRPYRQAILDLSSMIVGDIKSSNINILLKKAERSK